jgi:hypothetical protein
MHVPPRIGLAVIRTSGSGLRGDEDVECFDCCWHGADQVSVGAIVDR